MLRISCPCGETYNADEAHIGRYIQCRNCGNKLYIADPAKSYEISRTAENSIQEPGSHRGANKSSKRKQRRITSSRKFWAVIATGLIAVIAVFVFWPNRVHYTNVNASNSSTSTVRAETATQPSKENVPSETVTQPSNDNLPYVPVYVPPIPELEQAPPVSLANGTNIIRCRAVGGYGRLTVENGTSQDAAVRLKTNGETMRFVYVKAGHTISIRGVAPGVYDLLFANGVDWDVITQRFKRDKSYAKFEEPLDFREEETQTGIRYSTFRVTLHPVPSGNARTSSINESEFENSDGT